MSKKLGCTDTTDVFTTAMIPHPPIGDNCRGATSTFHAERRALNAERLVWYVCVLQHATVTRLWVIVSLALQSMSSSCPHTCSAQTKYQQHTAGGGVLRKPFCHSVQPFRVSRRTRCHRPACVTLSCRKDQTSPRTSQVAPRKQSQQHKVEALCGTALKAVAVLAALTVSSSSPASAELQARGFALQELKSLQ